MHTKEHQTMLKLASQAYMSRRSMDSTPTPSDMRNLDAVLATIEKDNPRIFLKDAWLVDYGWEIIAKTVIDEYKRRNSL